MTNAQCGNCKFWKPKKISIDFGECLNPATYSWVRGESFEPPKYFCCINYDKKVAVDFTTYFSEKREND